MVKRLNHNRQTFLDRKLKDHLIRKWIFKSPPLIRNLTTVGSIVSERKYTNFAAKGSRGSLNKKHRHILSEHNSDWDQLTTYIEDDSVKFRSLLFGQPETVSKVVLGKPRMKTMNKNVNSLPYENQPDMLHESEKIQSISVNEDNTLSANRSSKMVDSRSFHLQRLNYTKKMLQKVAALKYREKIFKAASRLTKDMPPYPDWIYEDQEIKYLNSVKINVGGRIFRIFEDRLLYLVKTKLAACLRVHKKEGIPFFDRDPICFAAVIQFFRTGRLHTPPNICLALFDEELEFWGVNENFLEPCCWSDYNNFKISCNKLKKYNEDINKGQSLHEVTNSQLWNWRKKFYYIITSGSGSVLSQWLSLICTFSIIVSVLLVLSWSSPMAREDPVTHEHVEYEENELVSHFLMRTDVIPLVSTSELIITGYFLTELVLRLILCPDRLKFFSETLNWVDLIAITSSLLSSRIVWQKISRYLEGYLMLLKIPRILRLIRLTTGLRSGMEAFILTLRASAKELKLVLLILLIAISVFGSLLFVVEMVNETETNKSNVKNIYLAMWLAIITMSRVGYGDIHIVSWPGYLVASVCILSGIIICQLPVPIFLQNFRTYYNQASARFNRETKMPVKHIDPESVYDAALSNAEGKQEEK